jgi:hypothetical protein
MNTCEPLSFEVFYPSRMKKLFALFFLLPAFSLAQQLSPEAKISVMTLGPWQGELYSAFGHSAFRVSDPSHGIDYAYNYGVFDFDQPNFYLNFARGYLYYKLGVYPYRNFEYHYIYHNRYVHEQVLNLTAPQKQRLFDSLQWNARPENQFYRYDYFYNNCATKIPGVIQRVFKDSVTFDGSYVQTDYTIRELTDLYLEYQPWGDLGIDIGLGLPIDKKATPYEYMFLPDYVESGFAHATILHGNKEVPLVAETNNIYESRPETFSKGLFQPLYVFIVLFVIAAVISYRDLKHKKITGAFDVTLFTVLGILGVLLLLLWVATDHRASAKNMNLLWALPTHLVAVVAFIRQPKWLENYFFSVTILMLALLLLWVVLPQKLHFALIPVVMTAGLRAFVQFRIRSLRNKGKI